ncbi:DUF5677 domain-containing protein [Phytomonospora sp. NPDC050363]|uniref:DUF5677 domain-containing protein n=1 Tax=Phytomonospora sp. NPDC050363 TaxID=3155642 RepID=UPI0033CE5C18
MAAREEERFVEDPFTDEEVLADAADYVRRLLANRRTLARRHERREARRLRRHRRMWKPALRMFTLTRLAMADLVREHGRELAQDGPLDEVSTALLLLWGHAARCVEGVEHSLAGGYVDDAQARARTVFEHAVMAHIIGEYGREPGSDLAERFLAHRLARLAKDIELQQEYPDPELSELPADQVEAVREQVRGFKDRWGEKFGQTYGWAHGLPGMGKTIKFEHLQQLVRTDHIRIHYRHASHLIHSDALTLFLSEVESPEGPLMAPAGTSFGLIQPATWSLWSLGWCTESRVLHSPLRADDGGMRSNKASWLVGTQTLLEATAAAFEATEDLAEQRADRDFERYLLPGWRGRAWARYLTWRDGGPPIRRHHPADEEPTASEPPPVSTETVTAVDTGGR